MCMKLTLTPSQRTHPCRKIRNWRSWHAALFSVCCVWDTLMKGDFSHVSSSFPLQNTPRIHGNFCKLWHCLHSSKQCWQKQPGRINERSELACKTVQCIGSNQGRRAIQRALHTRLIEKNKTDLLVKQFTVKHLTFTMVVVQFVNDLGKDRTITVARNYSRAKDSCTD